jgi:cyclopropane fatty-acyl-phospholipid synthase-like methyltransferase
MRGTITISMPLLAVPRRRATRNYRTAQLNKLQRITAKLDLRAGMAVAEIGSDWGSPVSPARV